MVSDTQLSDIKIQGIWRILSCFFDRTMVFTNFLFSGIIYREGESLVAWHIVFSMNSTDKIKQIAIRLLSKYCKGKFNGTDRNVLQ